MLDVGRETVERDRRLPKEADRPVPLEEDRQVDRDRLSLKREADREVEGLKALLRDGDPARLKIGERKACDGGGGEENLPDVNRRGRWSRRSGCRTCPNTG